MKRDIIIVGGGAVGLMCAYALVKQGRDVTVIDEGDITNSTSFGNAGLLSAFDKSPLSYPGVVGETLKLMLKGESPLTFHPTLDLKIYRWLLKFVQSASEERMKKSMALFEKYGQLALDLYTQMQTEDGMDLDLQKKGLLMVYTQEETFKQKVKKSQNEERFEILDVAQTKHYLPCANDRIQGSVLLKKNAHIDPRCVMLEMKAFLEKSGVHFILNEKIEDLIFENGDIRYVKSKEQLYEANTVILSTGYQIKLARKELMLTPAKGYSITFEMPEILKPKTSLLFADMFIAMTPRRNDVRITSKLEIGSNNKEVVQKQINSIKENFKRYTLPFEMKNPVEWCGFRPLTPNDMPLLGRDEKYRNLIYANGLGWLGITFAPAIGEIIANLITKEQANGDSDDIMAFSGFFQ
ncbi:NAD(P)/FAD-dependent oxidoreductase [Candidatus Marinarcus aquaticus]|uniref:FAD-dependent oxidoreductase n=1 Tax=Candidatus Marinarcus aquaticus TaxID=2044504 RepID=A0A4Q0XTK8_9BACT|nr:FAD-dependent oxidoreductase [Candidatus Marinarcus aquaticus]RXJ60692.1 FAD-dependent oxidoreductase [Candidatus Marinarcus aquaticus]